jgi:hypothetical protein
MRLMHSGRDFAWLYERQDQASFLDGHVRAFAHLGGVPHRLAYDNLRAAVARILVGSERKLTQRFEALASHYLFEACFCRPRTGHDKGGVEARGKGIRWQHLVPIPQGRSLDEISAALLAKLDAQQVHGRDAERRTTAERFELERTHLLAVPPGRFESGTTVLAGVTRRALVRIEGAYYSVWCRWAGLDVTAIIRAFEVVLVGPGAEQVVHPRLRFGQRAIDYRHYLAELRRKPQALRQVADELVRDLGKPFDAAWRSLCEAHGSRQAARIFAKVLDHLVRRGTDAVAHVVAKALSTGTPLLLALADSPRSTDPLRAELVPDSLRGIDIEAGQAGDYDALLDAGALRAGGVR